MPTNDPLRRGTWYQATRILHPPDLIGQGASGRGRAWRVDLDVMRRLRPNPDDATVASWVVHCPGGHSLWDHWMMSIMHLRPIEGGTKEPTLKYPDATHEVMFFALNPEQPVPDPKHLDKLHYLQPCDFTEQCKLNNDADADRLLLVLVTLCVDGMASPDVDFSGFWTAALWKTAKRLNEGNGETIN